MSDGTLRRVHVVQRPDQAAALLNPLRAEILACLREPASPAQVARELGESPQRMNYHIKELAKVGLVRRVGTRNVRNLVEVLYQAIAQTFVLSDAAGWDTRTVQALKDQGSLGHLVTVADRLRRDALTLLERSEAGSHIPSASLLAEVRLADEGARAAFVREYVDLVRHLTEKYAAREGSADAAYTVLLAVYPKMEEASS